MWLSISTLPWSYYATQQQQSLLVHTWSAFGVFIVVKRFHLTSAGKGSLFPRLWLLSLLPILDRLETVLLPLAQQSPCVRIEWSERRKSDHSSDNWQLLQVCHTTCVSTCRLRGVSHQQQLQSGHDLGLYWSAARAGKRASKWATPVSTRVLATLALIKYNN